MSLKIPGLWIVLSTLMLSQAEAYSVPVHIRMSQSAYDQSVLSPTKGNYLAMLGKTNNQLIDGLIARDWIWNGSDWEDSACCSRPLNHFYDPTTGFGLLNLSEFIATDAVNWALERQTVGTLTQNWSLRDARSYYYHALADQDPRDREVNMAKTFRALGHVIHLIQDMAQPQHVRDDPHYETEVSFLSFLNWDRSRYEEYTLRNQRFLTYAGYAPVDLPEAISYWDASDGRGLAEVTNQNFFSERYTITCSLVLCGESGYQQPTINLGTGTDDVETLLYADGTGQSGTLTFFPHTFVDPITNETVTNSRVLTLSLFDLDLQDRGVPLRFSQNPFTFEESQKILIPRAVGYSAGLLNQFFRNDIEITLPPGGVYAVTADTDPLTGKFTEVRLNARNLIPTGEMLSNGTIEMVVHYRISQGNPFQGQVVPTSQEVTHVVVPVANNVRAIPTNEPVELVFSLTDSPIPLLATDLRIQVVYKGELKTGDVVTATDAVVVGYYDLSEPTPITLVNNMDHICINGQYLVAGSAEAIAAVDSNHNGQADEQDVYAHGVRDLYLRLAVADMPQPASPAVADHQLTVASINPAEFGEVFVLTDYRYSLNLIWSAARLNESEDTHGHFTLPYSVPSIPAVKNQFDVVNGAAVREVSLLVPIRGKFSWRYVPFENSPVSGSFCAQSVVSAAEPPLTGPVSATVP